MITFNTITLHDIPRIAKMHASLDEVDKRFYHPCKMSLWYILAFLIRLYIKSRFNRHTTTIAAIDNSYNTILGFLFLRHRDSKCELGIVVSPYCRESGIGKMLMYRATKYARSVDIDKIWLKVLKDNYAAVKLYLNSGFRVTKTIHNTYKGEARTYYEMELKINETSIQ